MTKRMYVVAKAVNDEENSCTRHVFKNTVPLSYFSTLIPLCSPPSWIAPLYTTIDRRLDLNGHRLGRQGSAALIGAIRKRTAVDRDGQKVR